MSGLCFTSIVPSEPEMKTKIKNREQLKVMGLRLTKFFGDISVGRVTVKNESDVELAFITADRFFLSSSAVYCTPI